MRRILGYFLVGYLFVLSWTSAFTIHPLLPPHVLFGIVSIIALGGLFAAGDRFHASVYRAEDILVGVLLIGISIAAIVHPRGIDSLKYLAAYTYVFIGGYALIKLALYNTLDTRLILDATIAGVIVASGVSVIELVLDYSFGIDVGKYLLRTQKIPATYLYLPRSSSFSSEPGILAFYLETLGLIAAYSIWHRAWSWGLKAVCLAIISAGWAATFSAGSVAALLIGGLVAMGVKILSSRNVRSFLIFLFIPIFAGCTFAIFNGLEGTFFGPLVSKIALQDYSSVADRLQRWREGFATISKHFLVGEGPGTASASGEGSNISWYIFLTAEAGVVSLLPVLAFVASKFFRIINSWLRARYVFIVAFTAGAAHLAVISTFFHPFLWALLAIFGVMDVRSSEKTGG